uniref:Uncharacterized protein n=1 Tax=Callithrix jacchus TaxID=9483 RepID=A0A8I3VZ06_CALJA
MESHSVAPAGVCSGAISAYCRLRLPSSRDSLASASWVAGIPAISHHARQIFLFLVEMGFHHVGQAGLELLTSEEHKSVSSHRNGVQYPSTRNPMKAPAPGKKCCAGYLFHTAHLLASVT